MEGALQQFLLTPRTLPRWKELAGSRTKARFVVDTTGNIDVRSHWPIVVSSFTGIVKNIEISVCFTPVDLLFSQDNSQGVVSQGVVGTTSCSSDSSTERNV